MQGREKYGRTPNKDQWPSNETPTCSAGCWEDLEVSGASDAAKVFSLRPRAGCVHNWLYELLLLKGPNTSEGRRFGEVQPLQPSGPVRFELLYFRACASSTLPQMLRQVPVGHETRGSQVSGGLSPAGLSLCCLMLFGIHGNLIMKIVLIVTIPSNCLGANELFELRPWCIQSSQEMSILNWFVQSPKFKLCCAGC